MNIDNRTEKKKRETNKETKHGIDSDGRPRDPHLDTYVQFRNNSTKLRCQGSQPTRTRMEDVFSEAESPTAARRKAEQEIQTRGELCGAI